MLLHAQGLCIYCLLCVLYLPGLYSCAHRSDAGVNPGREHLVMCLHSRIYMQRTML